MSEKTSGKLKWFNNDKGYGFIEVAGMDKDVFVHAKQLRASGIVGNLADGTPLNFALKDGPRGKFATYIVKA